MVSRRKRSNSSVGNKLNTLTDKVTGQEKLQQVVGTQTNAVTNDSIALGAVNTESVADRSITSSKIGRGEVTSENLGVINEIIASGGLDIETGVDGHLSLSGGKYEEPYDGIEDADGYKILAFDPTNNTVKVIDNTPVITLDDIDDATITSPSVGQGLVYNSSGVWVNSAPPSYNYIINGAFDIWQRGPGAFSTASSSYTADRWTYSVNVSSATMARDLDVPNRQFQYSIKFVPNSNVTSSEYVLRQVLERQHIQNLVGKTVTVSCWVKSSKTSVKIRMIAAGTGGTTDTETLVTVAANTWTRISASFTSFSGITAWTNAGEGIGGYLDIGYQNGVAVTTSDTLFVTGVQLEEGSVATPFHRNAPSIQAELAACQRYYWTVANGNSALICNVMIYNTTALYGVVQFPVTMRAAPTMEVTTGTNYYQVERNNGSVLATAINAQLFTTTNSVGVGITGLTGQTAGQAGWLKTNNASAYLAFRAEL